MFKQTAEIVQLKIKTLAAAQILLIRSVLPCLGTSDNTRVFYADYELAIDL